MKILNNLKIEKLVYGGNGLSRTSGETVFVSNVLPGEIVTATEVHRKRGVIFADPVEILMPSPDRTIPPCRYYLSCGGCNWQHIAHPAQIREKQHILTECFMRIGKISTIPEIETIAADPWKYRIRAQFKLDHSVHSMGFFRQNSHEVVDITECPLLDDKINQLLGKKEQVFSLLPSGISEIKTIAGTTNTVASSPVLPGLTSKNTEITVGAINFRVSGRSFFQANRFLHHSQGTWAYNKIQLPYCIDLYGGAGFFSCLLGEKFDAGILVENDNNDAALAIENYKANRLTNFKVIRADADTLTPASIQFPAEKTCLIIDPPRTGLSRKVLQYIASFSPGQILYISCDPSTQARDIGSLVSTGKYSISHTVLFDLYPQTHHIESGVLLQKIAG